MAEAAAKTASRKGALWPPIYVGAIVVLCALGIAAIRQPDVIDNAIANILTLVLSFIAVMTMTVWFVFFSGHSKPLRWGVAGALVAALALALISLKIEGASGELIPRLVWRFTPPHDRQLKQATVEEASEIKVLPDINAADFPAFLGGPDHTAALEKVLLAKDWNDNRPVELWRRKIGAGWCGFATVGDFAYTMEQRGDNELVACYDIPSGKVRWVDAISARHATTLGGVGPRATPTVADQYVAALGATGVLRCLSGTNGKLIWKKDLLVEFGVSPAVEEKNIAWGRAASPLIVDGLVVIPAGGPSETDAVSLVAYDLKTGEERWRGGKHQVSYVSPQLTTFCGVRQILIINESTLAGHDISTGKQLWEYPWPGSSNREANNSQPHVLDDRRLFLSKGYFGGGMLLEGKVVDGQIALQEVWENFKLMKTKFTNCALKDGYAYGLSDGILECIDVGEGKRAWKSRQGRYGHGQLLRVGDVLLIIAEDGTLAMVEANPEEFKELARFQAVEGQTWNTLTLSGDRLLVRNAQEAACYRIKLADRGEVKPADAKTEDAEAAQPATR